MAYCDLDYSKEIQNAKDGDVESMFNVASYIIWGNLNSPVEPEMAKSAIKYYTICAENGNTDAMLDLGAMYLEGRGVERDRNKALAWYEKAAALGGNRACRCIGNFYRYDLSPDGFPVPTNDTERLLLALDWYKKGSGRDEENCLYELGDYYRYGIIVAKDESKAFELYQKALNIILTFIVPDDLDVNDSYSDVCLRLAECHHYGIGTAVDMTAARYYICIARDEIKERLARGDLYGASAMSRAEAEWQKLFNPVEPGDDLAALTPSLATRMTFLGFMDYEEGKIARMETIGDEIPLNIFIDNADDFDADAGKMPCEIRIYGDGQDITVFGSAEEYRKDSENKMAVISMIPVGTFPAGDNGNEFIMSPYILFTGKVLYFECDTYAEPDEPNYVATVETLDFVFSLYFRYNETLAVGNVVQGVAWLYGDIEQKCNYAIMGEEPLPGRKPEEILEWYNSHHTEAGLAHAFADASNEFFWVEDDEYDYEDGTPENEKAQMITDAWGELMDKLKEEIFVILRSEGIAIPERGQISVLKPFMERNGYYDRSGWWLPKAEKRESD